jgi:hypothetical protein
LAVAAAGSAIVAAVMGRSVAPKALEICRRSCSDAEAAAGRVRRTVCRIVEFAKASESFCERKDVGFQYSISEGHQSICLSIARRNLHAAPI